MKRMVRLDGVADQVVKTALEDKEIRDDVRNATRAAVKGGVSVFRAITYTVGGVALLAVAFWGVNKIIKTSQEARERREFNDLLEQQAQATASSRTRDELWFKNASQKLQAAMQTPKGYNAWFVSYDEEKILQVLRGLGDPADWIYLQTVFKKKDGHTLPEWLGLDDASDIRKYNKVLQNLGVDDMELISNVSTYGFHGTDRIL